MQSKTIHIMRQIIIEFTIGALAWGGLIICIAAGASCHYVESLAGFALFWGIGKLFDHSQTKSDRL